MIAGLIGLTSLIIYLTLGYLCDARYIDSWSSPVFFILMGAPIVLLIYWIVRLVLAIKRKNRIALLFLGIELALALVSAPLQSGNRPLIYRVQAEHVALERAALAAPQGNSQTLHSVGSFPVRSIIRKKDIVWFECWRAFLGVEGIVYSPTPSIPERQSYKCSYQPLTGNWYLWYEDQF
ncbi:MAG: hypothetical protein QM758_07650 [Armatimonas sp.]